MDEFLAGHRQIWARAAREDRRKLGDLAESVFATLKSGGKSEKLSKLLDALADAAWRISWRSILDLPGLLTTPASCLRCSTAPEISRHRGGGRYDN